MRKKEVYIVICRNKNFEDWTCIDVSQECYSNKEQAINFCKSRMNKEEVERYEKTLARGLISWYEFDTRKYEYRIKVLELE